jgi:dTMP kinase
MNGALLTFEGIEGCGKSTQVRLAEEYLLTLGLPIVRTREPGGTAIGGHVRQILLDAHNIELAPMAELLLYEADRAQHVAERIRPALRDGQLVLCDRFIDSTTAYQCAGRGLARDIVRELNAIATSGLQPNMTVLLDVPVEAGLLRVARAGQVDRIEQESLIFHERVRQAFLQIAREEPERVKVVDGEQSVEQVAADVRRHLDAWLASR